MYALYFPEKLIVVTGFSLYVLHQTIANIFNRILDK